MLSGSHPKHKGPHGLNEPVQVHFHCALSSCRISPLDRRQNGVVFASTLNVLARSRLANERRHLAILPDHLQQTHEQSIPGSRSDALVQRHIVLRVDRPLRHGVAVGDDGFPHVGNLGWGGSGCSKTRGLPFDPPAGFQYLDERLGILEEEEGCDLATTGFAFKCNA
ncbi:MAG: hypothetical protein RDU83_10145 [bacterium]|nr:hypothetical protein [bacterium]